MKIAFIGAGTMAEAIIKGISALKKENIIIASDIRKQRLSYLKKKYEIMTFSSNKKCIENADIIILAIKPIQAKNVLLEIKDNIKPFQKIVSIMAGISIAKIESLIEKKNSVIRIMPNLPCLIKQGISAICTNKSTLKKDKQEIMKIFKTIGEVLEVKENLMDVVTGLSGSGPAYIFLFIKSLKDAGISLGLNEKQASLLALQTILGSAQLALQSKESLLVLIEKVRTPGGTTNAGLNILEKQNFESILIDAVKAATQRSKELAELN